MAGGETRPARRRRLIIPPATAPPASGTMTAPALRELAWPTVLNECLRFLRFRPGQDRHRRLRQRIRSHPRRRRALCCLLQRVPQHAGCSRVRPTQAPRVRQPESQPLSVSRRRTACSSMRHNDRGRSWSDVGKTFPFASRNSIEPLMMYGPFGLTSIVTSAMRS